MTPSTMAPPRVRADGNHLALDGATFRVRGVTYGSFAPRDDGALFPDAAQMKQDLHDIATAGLNVVRTYTAPPPDLLEVAAELGLRLLVGVHYEDWRYHPTPGRATHRRVLEAGRRALADAMEVCAGNPDVLAVSVGNEVPGDVARVHGIGAVQDVLGELVADVHAADPAMLATYANFPTTEYLEVPGQDLACFNVFLEDPDAFRRYVKRLQVRVGDVPLLITELGLAAGAEGEEAQADALSWQLRTVDELGTAGATVFSWTDEWDVDGYRQDDWGFGITDSERRPKPALEVVERWARSRVDDLREQWPTVSVVVCAYNEERRIGACLRSLERCDYPALEVIVCDDGSTDGTLAIARQFPFRVLDLDHGGLSRARNAGMEAASGDIVAYLDADAQCHPEWPFHLVMSLEEDVVATGGPNLPLPNAPVTEHAVAASPGGPVHVLVADDRAEHVPGCNMAYEKWALEQVGGFNPAYTSAGDDVDVCWKLLDQGYQIGFSQAAQVRHHRRDSLRGYLKQQRGYGRAEAMLAGAHPHRFNRLGQARWSGFIYGGLRPLRRLLTPVIYHGHLGEAPYQGIYRPRAETALAWIGALLPLSVPTALVGLALAVLSPWWLVLPAVAVVLNVLTGVLAARAAVAPSDVSEPGRYRALVGLFHVLQPHVRTWGRLRGQPVEAPHEAPHDWYGDRLTWVVDLRRALERRGCAVDYGTAMSTWDLEARIGPLARATLTTAITWNWEPHHRIRLHPRPLPVLAATVLTAGVAVLASPWSGVAMAGVVVAAGAVEVALLRSQVRGAVDDTTPDPRTAGRDAADDGDDRRTGDGDTGRTPR